MHWLSSYTSRQIFHTKNHIQFTILGNMNMSKYLLGLAQAPAYLQELTTGILKDFDFAIAYLDDISISAGQQKNIYPTLNRSLRNYKLQNSP